MTTSAGVLRVGVLGPLEVRVDAEAWPVPTGNQRRLLASLLLARGHLVHHTQLVEDVWGFDAPSSPRAAVHTTVARLRRALGPAGPVVVSHETGYLLDTGRLERDDVEFVRLAAVGPATDAEERVRQLDRALGLWRGPAWGDLAEDLARGDAARLEEQRLQAREHRATALVEAGRPGDAVGDLRDLVAGNPLRERGVVLLMDALQRHGATGEALDAFTRHRQWLADQLGLDPSPEAKRMHERVLRQELPAPAPRVGVPTPRVSLPTPRGDVPRTPLVGRQALIVTAADQLAPRRAVTLVGPGGVGKTSLARVVAERHAEAGAQVWWVDLAPLETQTAVVAAVVTATGSDQAMASSDAMALGQRLSTARGLLVLDNCEQVLDASAALIDLVLSVAPEVAVLATSRERLRVPGERVLPVPPLSVGGVDAEDSDAVELFWARAREAAPDLIEDEAARRSARALCRKLDGLPLAIELAASRVGSMTVTDLEERLGSGLDLLRSPSRTLPARHRTLRDAVAWSYDLLSIEERRVFDALSVFAGEFDLGAAERVLAAAGQCVGSPVESIASLVDRSLVARPTGTGRYRVLQPLRAFGAEHLDQQETHLLRECHASWVARVAYEAGCGVRGPEERVWTTRLLRLMPDLRAAFGWCLVEDLDTAYDITGALSRWAYLGLRTEVLGWALAALDAAPQPPSRVLAAAAMSKWVSGSHEESADLARRAIETAGHGHRRRENEEDSRAVGLAHDILGDNALFTGDLLAAREHYTASVTWALRRGLLADAAMGSVGRALTATYGGEDGSEQACAALATAGRSENPSALAWAWYALGETLADTDPPRALTCLERARSIDAGAEQGLLHGVAMTATAAVLSRHGPLESPTFQRMAEAIGFWVENGNTGFLVTCLRNTVPLLVRAGLDDAAIGLGATLSLADTEHASYGTEATHVHDALAEAATRRGDVAIGRHDTWVSLVEAARSAVTTLREAPEHD